MKSRTANRLINLGGPGSGPRPHGGNEPDYRGAPVLGNEEAMKASEVANRTGKTSDHAEAAQAHSEAAEACRMAGDKAGASFHEKKSKTHAMKAD